MTGTVEKDLYTAPREERDRRILEHLPLVRRIAHWFAAGVPRWVDSADLVSAGIVGLIRAVDRFDAERGVSFESFASPYIRGAVLDHLRAQDPLPYSTRVKVRQLDRACLDLERRLERTPHLAELAKACGWTEDEVEELLLRGSASKLYSIEDLVSRGEDPPAAAMGSPANVLVRLEEDELVALVVRHLGELQGVDRLVLTLRYYEGMKMKDIATVLEVSESRVSQIHARALSSLRGRLRESLEQG